MSLHLNLIFSTYSTSVPTCMLPSLKGLVQAKIIKFINKILILDNRVTNMKYENFVSISSLTGKCSTQKIKNFCISSLSECLHHMVILISQNKITDFFMILA